MASNNHLKQLSCHPHVASDLSTALRVPSDTTEKTNHKKGISSYFFNQDFIHA